MSSQLQEMDYRLIEAGFHRISQTNRAGVAGSSGILTIKDVLPERLFKVARKILKARFGTIYDLRTSPYRLADIIHEVKIWRDENKTRICRWYECEKETTGNFRYCDKHRAEITDIARMGW